VAPVERLPRSAVAAAQGLERRTSLGIHRLERGAHPRVLEPRREKGALLRLALRVPESRSLRIRQASRRDALQRSEVELDLLLEPRGQEFQQPDLVREALGALLARRARRDGLHDPAVDARVLTLL
jgi:hypothetical protein